LQRGARAIWHALAARGDRRRRITRTWPSSSSGWASTRWASTPTR